MERKVYLILFLILFSFLGIALMYGQVESPYVSSTPPPGQYHPLSELWINSTEVNWQGLTFINISKIGIGTLAPQNALDVVGNIWSSGSLMGSYLQVNYVNGSLIPYSNVSFNLGSSSNWWANLYVQNLYVGSLNGQAPLVGSGTANYIPIWTSSNSLGNSVIYQSGSNVGIGTTSPSYTLTVNGNIGANNIYPNSNNTYSLGSSSNMWANIYGVNIYGSTFYDVNNPNYYVKPSGTTVLNTLYLTNVPQTSDNNIVLTINSNGEISYINTSSWAKNASNYLTSINVENSAGATQFTITPSANYIEFVAGPGISISFGSPNQIIISHASTSSQSSVYNTGGTVIQNITLDSFGHVTGIQSINLDNRYVQGAGSGTANYIPIWTSSNSLGNSVIYQSGSSIGIGTTSPAATLDVNGNVIVSKSIVIRADGQNDAVLLSVNPAGQAFHVIGTYYGWDPTGVYIAGYNVKNNPSFSNATAVYIGGPGSTVAKFDLANSAIDFYVNAYTSNIIPSSNNTYSLGSSSDIWANAYIRQICLNPTCTAVIYWNGTALIIEAPQVYILSS